METTSNERMAKSELNAAEKMNMPGIERIKAILETLNEGHKLDEVRTCPIYYSDSAILYNKCNCAYKFMSYADALCVAFAFIGKSVQVHTPRPITMIQIHGILHET